MINNTLKLTNLKKELIENGDSDYDLSLPDDADHIIAGMIMSRSKSAEEVAERAAALVTVLQPKDVEAVYWQACLYAKAKAADVKNGNHLCIEERPDALAAAAGLSQAHLGPGTNGKRLRHRRFPPTLQRQRARRKQVAAEQGDCNHD